MAKKTTQKKNLKEKSTLKRESNSEPQKSKNTLLLISVVGLIILAIILLNGNNSSDKIGSVVTNTGEEQVISMKVDAPEYIPSEIVVEKDRPVKLIVDGDRALGCMRYLVIQEVGIEAELQKGENVFQFTPQREGEFRITCSMGMGEGVLKVVDKLESKDTSAAHDEIDHSMHKGHNAMKNQEGFLPGKEIELQNLPRAQPSTIVELNDGDTFTLNADFVEKTIRGKKYVMYGYNGMIPGPAIKVNEESTITVEFTNNIDWDTTVHWHGLRHDIAHDGTPGVSQEPVKPGESFSYKLYFPDAGIYWYHPHIREDIQQDNGLAGNMLVNPQLPDYWSPVNREELIVLDDILIEDGEVYPFGKDHANHAIMGRYGDVLLTNGEEHYDLEVNKGDVIRFYVTNVANVRPYNIHIQGAQMKLVGSDLGGYEKETFVDSVIIAPAERYIIEVLFENVGEFELMHTHPDAEYVLGTVTVVDTPSSKDYSTEFNVKRENQYVVADISQFTEYFDKEVDYELVLDIDMPGMEMMMDMDHMGAHDIEWEDTMKAMNEIHTGENTRWIIRDAQSGKENMDLMMKAKVGDKIKIRLVNDPDSMHPMQHPIHLHGQRFLVLEEDGIKNANLVWKDTVLVPVGTTTDILVDVTNPGEWMIHCHIAEHLESGMMAMLMVEE